MRPGCLVALVVGFLALGAQRTAAQTVAAQTTSDMRSAVALFQQVRTVPNVVADQSPLVARTRSCVSGAVAAVSLVLTAA